MPTVTIEIDNETDAKARALASSVGIGYSEWLAELIRAHTLSNWPTSMRALAGSIPDFPLANELRQNTGTDIKRERIA